MTDDSLLLGFSLAQGLSAPHQAAASARATYSPEWPNPPDPGVLLMPESLL